MVHSALFNIYIYIRLRAHTRECAAATGPVTVPTSHFSSIFIATVYYISRLFVHRVLFGILGLGLVPLIQIIAYVDDTSIPNNPGLAKICCVLNSTLYPRSFGLILWAGHPD
jgi:hypothetical protein